MFLTLAKVSFVMHIVAVLFFLVAVALVLIVLIQKGKGGGLSGAFGGAGGQSSVFGSKTGDVLTWATIVVAFLFLLLAVLLTKFYKPSAVELPGGPAPATQQAPTQKAPAAQTPATKAPAAAAPAEANATK